MMSKGPSSIEAEPGRAGLAYIGKRQPKEPTATAQQKADAKALFGPGAVVAYEGAAIYGWKKATKSRYVFCWTRDGALCESELVADAPSEVLYAWDHGRSFLTTTTRNDSKIWSIDASDGRVAQVFDAQDEGLYFPCALAFERVLFTLHSGGYVVCKRGEDRQWREERRDRSDIVEARRALGGRVVVYTSDHPGNALRFLVSTPSGLVAAGELAMPRGCQMYRFDDNGPAIEVDDGWYVLSNLDSVAAAAERA